MALTPRQWLALAVVTLIWGLNWPVMKIGVTGFPPLAFRAACLWLAMPTLAVVMWARRIPFHVPVAERRQVAWLGLTNMLLWNILIILAIPRLSSGRAAILGYTMPVFAALLGAWLFREPFNWRHGLGVLAALAGALLLLWHEMAAFAGQPLGVLLALGAAFWWGLGTQMLRRARISVHLATMTFWMMVLAVTVLTVASALFERDAWVAPSAAVWAALAYNGLLVLVFSQLAWFYLARSLPPQASTLSVMLIPVLGVFSGAWWLRETLHWQDYAAVVLMLVSMASVLWPRRA